MTAGSSQPHPQTDVLVVGGGIAGMAAAIRLAEAGQRVRLLETRKKLGGRATSFKDTRSGEVLDNCQHVVLGCCTNYLDLLNRLGARNKLRWYREQYWIDRGGQMSIIKRGRLPAPMHFGLSMLRAPLLSMLEAASVGRACAAIMRVDRRDWTDRTFSQFLRSVGQSDRVMSRFWMPVVVSACNLGPERVAASSALHVFQEGFLASESAADIGVPAVPLVDLYEQAVSLIERNGGSVLFGAGVERATPTTVTTTDGQTHIARAVILAVPVERVVRLIDPGVRASDPRFAPLERFTHSPILGVHLTFDRSILGGELGQRSLDGTGVLPHCVLVDRPTQWIFRKDFSAPNGGSGGGGGGKSIHAVISAADDWVELTEQQIAGRVVADLRACLPDADGAKLVSVRAIKEKLATFAPTPGLDALRPDPAGSSGIFLAGDYTNTGWPATMEGATRGGYAAAAAVLAKPRDEFVVPSLRVAVVPRALGLLRSAS